MPPEKTAQTHAWLRKAASDLGAAELDLGASSPFVEDALFHCQQAVEKSLKGFLLWHDKSFRKTHDLRELSGAAISVDTTLEPVLKAAVRLTPFASFFRYPGDTEEPDPEEGVKALNLARKAYEAILKRVPE